MSTHAAFSALGPSAFLGELDSLLTVYANAMGAAPEQLPGRRELMRRHAGHPSFLALVARAIPARVMPAGPAQRAVPGGAVPGGAVPGGAVPGGAVPGGAVPGGAVPGGAVPGGRPIGFAYGFHGASGQWWYDTVRSALISAAGRPTAMSWLSDCLEIAELHVHTSHQRMGIGSRLLMAIASGRAERTALLSTPDRESAARRLYRRAGFADLLTGFSFPGGSPPYAVMGAVLPLSDPVPATDRYRSARPSIW